MRTNPGRTSVILFFFTTATFLVIAWVSFQRLNNLIDSMKRVTALNENRLELRELMVRITQAESSQRGYLLSGDSLFLVPYKEENILLQQSFSNLKAGVIGNPVQMERVLQLEKVVQLRMESLSKNLRNGTIEKIVFQQQMLKGMMYMQEVEKIYSALMEDLSNEYNDALGTRKRYQEATPVILFILSLFVVLLFVMSYFVIRKQLSARIHFQEELEIRIEALNRSNNELEQFAYVASHDLQEPLRKIQAFGDKLVHKQLLIQTDEAMDTVQRMRSAASRMQILINELLAFSRLNRPNVVHQFETVALNLVVKEVLNDLQVLIQEKNALITVEPLPVVEVVPSQMQQLFQNLIANSLKFARSDLRPVIRIYADLVSGYAVRSSKPSQAMHQFHRISVEDNGIGFDPQYQEKIFVIFQRLHGKMEYSGTGIGLAICRRIAANHNGYIDAESKPMRGAKFVLYLPVRQQEFMPEA